MPIVPVFKQNVLLSDLDHFLDMNLRPHKREEGTLSSCSLTVIYFCETLTVKSKPSKRKLYLKFTFTFITSLLGKSLRTALGFSKLLRNTLKRFSDITLLAFYTLTRRNPLFGSGLVKTFL